MEPAFREEVMDKVINMLHCDGFDLSKLEILQEPEFIEVIESKPSRFFHLLLGKKGDK